MAHTASARGALWRETVVLSSWRREGTPDRNGKTADAEADKLPALARCESNHEETGGRLWCRSTSETISAGSETKKAWTQEHLAEAAGISPRTVQRAEDGVLSAETLRSLAAAFDVTLEELTYDASAYPSITPFLYYEDGASFDWLVRVFGFTVRMKVPGPGGTVVHGELEHRGGIVMVGIVSPRAQMPEPEARGRRPDPRALCHRR